MACLTHTRAVNKFSRVFQVREDKLITDRTTWELLDGLLSLGWSLKTLAKKQRTRPLNLSKVTDVVDCIWFRKNALEVSRYYLVCLSCTRALALQGCFVNDK